MTHRDSIINLAAEDGDYEPDLRSSRFDGCDDAELASAIDYLAGLGFADDQTGDVKAPGGHAILMCRWLLLTDSDGFSQLVTHITEDIARIDFDDRACNYSDFLDAVAETAALN